MNVDYATLEQDVYSGAFREQLLEELTLGFRMLHQAGERLPLASYYASKIAEIVASGAPAPVNAELAYNIYQEILAACETARAAVLAEPIVSS